LLRPSSQLYPAIIVKTRQELLHPYPTNLPLIHNGPAMSMTTTTDGGDSMRRSAVRNPKRRPRITEGSNSPNGPQRKIRKLTNKPIDVPQSLDTTESLRSGLSALAVQSSASFSRTGDAATRIKRSPKNDNSTLLVLRPAILYNGSNC
jgi:hypothetical protein